MSIAQNCVTKALLKAGITIGGKNPWDITVSDNRFYKWVFWKGSLGLGEAYMEGFWECAQLDQFFEKVLKGGMPLMAVLNPTAIKLIVQSKIMDLAPRSKAFVVGKEHYDLGNRLFEAMLDTSMSYSCAYWKDATTLEKAQENKLDLICRKLNLRPGQRILDIGCGWGGFAFHAARQYRVKVVGLTVSKEQAAYAQNKCKYLPVEILLQDYREEHGAYDNIVSVGMFEHVGPENYRTYMKMVQRNLLPNGLFLLHTIGASESFFHAQDPWIQKYIFPVGEVPTRKQITRSTKGFFNTRDWHEFGTYYDLTLMSWYYNFIHLWKDIEEEYGPRRDGKFYRMWKYYLLACAGSFRAKNNELWQIVLSHPNKHQDYQPVR
ncbi:MAG: cyclopropane fatty acyl phospholipid synthase [Candidatus Paceibacterota bacterium]|jgi:cyclopropane-fatty-acyl-phospholipid synthase